MGAEQRKSKLNKRWLVVFMLKNLRVENHSSLLAFQAWFFQLEIMCQLLYL
jgi:hypothetical protein